MLQEIRVLDFTNYLPGPFTTMRLAELGAEVIKIEPESGDPGRWLAAGTNVDGAVFTANNRGKMSIALNLKDVSDRNIALNLISSADAVIESFRPGVMKRLGLDFETVRKLNEKIVYCSLTGYGMDGEYSHLGSHDLNYMAVSGSLAQMKDNTGKPVHPTNTFADFVGGFAASERLLAGILSAKLTGSGSYHCISIADVMTSLMGNHLEMYAHTGSSYGLKELSGDYICYHIYETSDARYMALAALEEKFWGNFCSAVGKQEWMAAHFSETHATNAVFRELQALFLSRTFAEWVHFAKEIDCCMTPVLETEELGSFPLFKERKLIRNQTAVKMFSDLNKEMQGDAPYLNEHGPGLKKELNE